MLDNQLMDVGQWLSFMSGYRMAKNLPKTSAGKLNEFVKVINEDLRGVIEVSTPIFFMYDSSIYEEAMLSFTSYIQTSPGSAYVKSIKLDSNTYIQRDDPEFNKYLLAAISKIQMPDISPNVLVSKVLKSNKSNDISAFADIVRTAVTALNEKISKLSVAISQGDVSAIGRGRLTATAAGRLVRQGFQKLTPCVLTNPEFVVAGYDRSKHAILLGANFANLRDSVNEFINTAYKNAFEKAGIILSTETTKKEKGKEVAAVDLKKKFKIGDFVVFGHTGAKYTDEKGIVNLIGINTPWTQQLLVIAANAGTQSSGIDILNQFASVSGQIDLSVEFTKQVSSDMKVLMTGSLAIVIPMLYSRNASLTSGEGAAADKIVSDLYGVGSTYLKIRNLVKSKIFSAQGIKNLITNLRFSPTITETLSKNIANTIRGIGLTNTSAKSKSSTSIGNKTSTGKRSPSSTKKLPLPKPRIPRIKPLAGQGTNASTISLASLQTLLDAQLQQRIKANMGTGSSKNVLNYRTGRLAASAKVERLSQSREGMITAFYSYMKNPYATFSQGGKQEYPKSRDPKLLISQSIKEIMATKVSARMRAVLI